VGVEAGWPIHHVQHTLGHADLKQASTYLNATVAGIEESMRRLDQPRGLLQSVAIEPATDPLRNCNTDQQPTAKELVN
jgi:hypothetical protein